MRKVLAWEEVSVETKPSQIVFKRDGVYLITGGLGGLGLVFANEILTRTRAARVILTGRSELSLEKQRRMDALPGVGGRVLYREMDLDDLVKRPEANFLYPGRIWAAGWHSSQCRDDGGQLHRQEECV